MNPLHIKQRGSVTAVVIASGLLVTMPATADGPNSRSLQASKSGRPVVSDVLRRAIPNAPGFEAHAIRVSYRPLQGSLPHTHDDFLIAYVLRGRIESRVEDGPLRTFHAGDSWTEAPGDHHSVCRNPSVDEPAEFLVVSIARASGAPKDPK